MKREDAIALIRSLAEKWPKTFYLEYKKPNDVLHVGPFDPEAVDCIDLHQDQNP